MLCLTSMRTNSGRDADLWVGDNETKCLIQRDAKTMHLAPIGYFNEQTLSMMAAGIVSRE